jgi:4-hydroxy-tetrahydrodipicolinate reductase
VYGVGRVNQLAVRLMRERGVQVVGAINRSGPKVGQDVGILAGLHEPIGVAVSDDVETVLSTPADLVLVAIYDDLERMMPVFSACIERGLNVISVGAHHSYPWQVTPSLGAELDRLAKRRNVTFTGTGNQDFFMVNLGTLMSGACQRIERLVHRSLTDVNGFGPEVAEVTFVGVSKSDFEERSTNFPPSIYTTFWHNVAADLDLTVVDTIQRVEPIVAQEPRYCLPFDRDIEPGELLGIRQHLEVSTAQGIELRGENEIRVAVPGEEDFKEWEIVGEPPLKVRASNLDNAMTTATQCINRIPHVVAAPPGYVTLEQLPKLTFRSRLGRQP